MARDKSDGVNVNVYEPGVIETKLLRAGGYSGSSVKDSGYAPAQLTTSDDFKNISGEYFNNKAKKASSSADAKDVAQQDRIWRMSEEICAKHYTSFVYAAEGKIVCCPIHLADWLNHTQRVQLFNCILSPFLQRLSDYGEVPEYDCKYTDLMTLLKNGLSIRGVSAEFVLHMETLETKVLPESLALKYYSAKVNEMKRKAIGKTKYRCGYARTDKLDKSSTGLLLNKPPRRRRRLSGSGRGIPPFISLNSEDDPETKPAVKNQTLIACAFY